MSSVDELMGRSPAAQSPASRCQDQLRGSCWFGNTGIRIGTRAAAERSAEVGGPYVIVAGVDLTIVVAAGGSMLLVVIFDIRLTDGGKSN